MAQRRMFSPQIVDSDAFLDMSSTAQSLYFHLGMRADDDGFVGNPRKILRMIGGNEDDLKILLAKRFLLIFETGVIVIKHWRMNNLIRKDWYKETVYKDEKALLEIKDNGSYTEKDNLVNENATIRSRRLGKVRLGKVRLGTNTSEQSSQIPLIIDLFKVINPAYKKWFGNITQRSACQRMLEIHGFEKLSKIIGFLLISNKEKFCPIATTPLQLEDKYAQIEAYWQKKSINQPLMNI